MRHFRLRYRPFFAAACFCAFGLTTSILLTTRASGQSIATNTPLVVRAQKQPGKPWVEYPTLTIEHLPGFDMRLLPRDVDEYGGLVQDKHRATGFFRTERIGARWWLIDPIGGLYYNMAVVSVTAGKSDAAAANVRKTFGSEKAWADSTTTMLRRNGFNGTGAWTDSLIALGASPRIPYTLTWNFMSSYGKKRGGTFQQPGHTGYPNDCIFVFDPEFERYADEYARRVIPTSADPYLIGHFLDNELPFPEDALDRYLQLDAADPGRVAARSWLGERHGDHAADITPDDRAGFLGFLAERYASITAQAVRKYDPHHLILGARFHGKTLDQMSVLASAGRYFDIVSINYYNTWTPDARRMDDWIERSGKPILITEWYVKGADAGLPNSSGAGWIVPTQKDRGLFYQNFALQLLQCKGCVGWQWFKYIDNDPKAKDVDPSNSDSNKGIVSITFEPYLPLLESMRELNVRTYQLIDYFDGRGAR
jgi:hypothetical protein